MPPGARRPADPTTARPRRRRRPRTAGQRAGAAPVARASRRQLVRRPGPIDRRVTPGRPPRTPGCRARTPRDGSAAHSCPGSAPRTSRRPDHRSPRRRQHVVQLLGVQPQHPGDHAQPGRRDAAVGGLDLRDRRVRDAGRVGQLLPGPPQALAPFADHAGQLVTAGLAAAVRSVRRSCHQRLHRLGGIGSERPVLRALRSQHRSAPPLHSAGVAPPATSGGAGPAPREGRSTARARMSPRAPTSRRRSHGQGKEEEAPPR